MDFDSQASMNAYFARAEELRESTVVNVHVYNSRPEAVPNQAIHLMTINMTIIVQTESPCIVLWSC